MLRVPKKVADRLRNEIEKWRKIVASQRERGVSEADTVTMVKDMLAGIFGYNKYEELTSEQQIRGTFCDLAVKVEGSTRFLIEVKAAGHELSEGHLRQVMMYGANHGIEWLVLTNALDWRLYRLKFAQPIDTEFVAEFNISSVDVSREEDLHKLFLLCREGLEQEAVTRFHRHGQQLNRYTLAQVVQTEPVIKAIRGQFKRLFSGLKLKEDAVLQMLQNEIFKPDLIEGEKCEEAARLVGKADKRRSKRKAAKASPPPETAPTAEAVEPTEPPIEPSVEQPPVSMT